MMTPDQMAGFKAAMGIPDGAEWEPLAGLDLSAEALAELVEGAPMARRRPDGRTAPQVAKAAAAAFETEAGAQSTQEAFGRIMNELGKADDELARRIVTTSPDVTVSTNLGGWVNQREVFHRHEKADIFRQERLPSTQRWTLSPRGRHIELGIAENNLFLLLTALGLSGELFGAPLLPIGTLYDPFISRGLDALNYGCSQGARFMVVGTPSGISLAPEGGAHQSFITPLIGMGQDGLSAFEPAFADELALLMSWGFEHMQADDGGAVYLRLSTRTLEQPDRSMTPELAAHIVAGGYWLVPPAPGAELAVVYCGAVVPEAMAGHAKVCQDIPGAGLLAVTSADRLHAGWLAAGHGGPAAHAEELLAPLAPDAGLVTLIDGHPTALDWLGSVAGQRVVPLGVERFGQSGDIVDLYREYGIDADAVLEAAAMAALRRVRG
jgi:pyruvate dehydrogenase E1 component